MFRQHKIICENKEMIIYLFLYDQDIELDTMKNIFSQLSTIDLEKRILAYLDQNSIKFLGQHIRIVFHSTIVKDFYLLTQQIKHQHIYANNVVSFYR